MVLEKVEAVFQMAVITAQNISMKFYSFYEESFSFLVLWQYFLPSPIDYICFVGGSPS